MSKIDFKFCDFNNSIHTEAFTSLLNQYMSDPMGDFPIHDESRKRLLVEGLSNHPTAFVIFIKCDGEFAGFSTCFVNFSTFKIKPFLYIHDVFIHPEFRGKKLGKKLMEKLVSISKERDYCKVTLEVRDDNEPAQILYRNLGFDQCKPNMFYWEKIL